LKGKYGKPLYFSVLRPQPYFSTEATMDFGIITIRESVARENKYWWHI